MLQVRDHARSIAAQWENTNSHILVWQWSGLSECMWAVEPKRPRRCALCMMPICTARWQRRRMQLVLSLVCIQHAGVYLYPNIVIMRTSIFIYILRAYLYINSDVINRNKSYGPNNLQLSYNIPLNISNNSNFTILKSSLSAYCTYCVSGVVYLTSALYVHSLVCMVFHSLVCMLRLSLSFHHAF